MATTRVFYKGKKELTMAQFETLTSLDDAVDYDIVDFPNGGITNVQMTDALGYSRLFEDGDVFVCLDNGTYTKGHTYQVKVDSGVKSWVDITPAGVELKHSEIKNVDTDSNKEDAWITSDTDAAISIYHQNGTTQAGFTTSKNYVEMACVDTTSTTASNAKVTISDDNVNIVSQDSAGNKEAITISPTEVLFSDRPKVQTNGTQSEVVIKDDLAGYVPVQSEVAGVALTWYMNENPDKSNKFTVNIDFTSNETKYNSFSIVSDPVGGDAIYYGSSVAHAQAEGEWRKEAYRTVVFDTAPSGELLTWLQANAVPQGSTSKTYAQITNENGMISFRTFENGDTDLQNLSITKDGVTLNGQPIGAEITVDSALSDSSENPVQNKVVNTALKDKLNILGLGESNRVYVRKDNNLDSSLPYTYSAEANSIAYRNPSGQLQVEDPSQDKDAVNKGYADKLQRYLSLSGEAGTLDDSQYELVKNYDNLIIQRIGLDFRRCGYPSNGQGNYIFVCDYYSKPNGTEEWVDYFITIRQDKTWETTLKNHLQISEQTYAPFVTISPDTATNGTFDEDDFTNLTDHDDVYIILNGEYYRLADNNHTQGIRTYTHTGWNGTAIQDKSINITTSTKAWTLVLGKNKYYRHYIQLEVDGKALYYDFSSTQKESYTADTLPEMPDTIITAFQIVAGGYYSSVSGLVYRNGEGNLKAIIHGMYTANGSSMSYLSLTGVDATFKADIVLEI